MLTYPLWDDSAIIGSFSEDLFFNLVHGVIVSSSTGRAGQSRNRFSRRSKDTARLLAPRREPVRKWPFAVFPGALFTHDQINSSIEIAFKFAVDQINRDANLLPHTHVSYDIRYVPPDNSFRAIKTGTLALPSPFHRGDIVENRKPTRS